jgi:hypothetical protein
MKPSVAFFTRQQPRTPFPDKSGEERNEMSIKSVSFGKLVFTLGLMTLLLAGGTAIKVNAQSATSAETSSEERCPESRFANCGLKGIYGFGYIGIAPQVSNPDSFTQYNPFATGGMWNFHGDGTFDAADTQVASGEAKDRVYSGTYSINPDGTGTADFTAGGLSHTRHLVIVNGGQTIEFIQTDGLVVGTMTKQ